MAYVGVKAGNLRHEVIVQSCTETRSASGVVTRTWPESGWQRAYADIRPLTQRSFERLAGSQLQGEVTHEGRIRYMDGLKPKDRLLYGVRILEVAGPPVNVEERNRVHELWLKEVVNPT